MSKEKEIEVRRSIKANANKVAGLFEIPRYVKSDILEYNKTAKKHIAASDGYILTEMTRMIRNKEI
jgi:hypothetical protein